MSFWQLGVQGGPDVYGCSCGPNSPIKDGSCCSGAINAQGQNCWAGAGTGSDAGKICKAAKGDALCCHDQFNAWCCPAGTACIPQRAGQWNPHSCTPSPAPPGSGEVAGSWRIAGGGPGHPENTGITFTMGVTKTASDTQATKISNAMKAESSFYGIKVSDEFKADWESTVTQTAVQTTTTSCTQSCQADYYLWVFKTQVTVPDDGLPYYLQDFAASCEAAICSPFGLAKPPRCPFGYQDDQKGGFQCCASNAWATPGAPGLPPICPGD